MMRFDNNSRILVVAAHPDDEVLGMGGTIARATSYGSQVFVLFLGEGISARFPVGDYDNTSFREQTEQRMNSAKRAMEILGVGKTIYGTRLCGQFDTISVLSIVKEIEEVIDSFSPTMLFTHNPSEVNIDHPLTYKAVEIACRPARAISPKEIYTFEIICSGGWTFESLFKPNVYVDIDQTWNQKMRAWHCYEGEGRPFPFPRSETGLTALAQYRGMACGLSKAEAFRLVRKLV